MSNAVTSTPGVRRSDGIGDYAGQCSPAYLTESRIALGVVPDRAHRLLKRLGLSALPFLHASLS